MSDDQVVEYLRTRGGSAMPPTLIDDVMRAVATTPQRHRPSWIAAFLPAAAAVAAIALIVLLANLVNAPPDVGPTPSTSPQPSQRVSVSPSPSPSPSPSRPPDASAATSLTEQGERLTMPALDPQGQYGMITLERGPDVASYANLETELPESFFLEVLVSYEVERLPDPTEWGRMDWTLRATDGEVVIEPFARPHEPGDNLLASWPGATVPETGTYAGVLSFAVPRDAAQAEMELVYQPTGLDSPAWTLLVREPGSPPRPLAPANSTPTPSYVGQPGAPITVIESAEADELFANPDSCTNPVGNYTVTFPDDWYTNTAIGDVPACSWFSPTFFEVDDPDEIPNEIAIVIDVFESATGQLWVSLYSEEVAIDGFEATRIEHGYTKEPDQKTNQYSYSYLARLDEDFDGRKFSARTDTDYGGDYLLNKAVLDRIMASLTFND